jgi:hypothetical protein
MAEGSNSCSRSQSQERQKGGRSPAFAILRVAMGLGINAIGLFCALTLSGCMPVPGETLTSGGLQRDIRARVLTLAGAARPACRRQSVLNTEVLELHPDGKVAAERWTVDRCGDRAHYRVDIAPRARGGNFVVREERHIGP